MGRKRSTVKDCPGVEDPMQCLNCTFEDCMLHDHFITKGGISKAVEEALAGSWDADDRQKPAAASHERYLRQREQMLDRQRARRAENRAALAEKQACIKTARLRRGLLLSEAARAIGVSYPTLSMWENGTAPANWAKVYRVFPELKEAAK